MKTRFLIALVTCCALASESRAQTLSPRVAQALSYLPPQSETLAVDQSSLPILPAQTKQSRGKTLVSSNASILPAHLQLAAVTDALVGRTIELSMEARSNFRAPKGFGLMPYDGSGLIYLKPQAGQTREMLKAAVWKGMERTTLAGQEIGTFEEKREYDLWRIYIAVPRPDLIVIATDRASMITTLSRMQRPKLEDRAIPSLWSGWKLVDTGAPFWAVRRLDLPTSTQIFNEDKRDPKARALVIFPRVRADKKTEWVVKCDGDPKNLRAVFTSIMREAKGRITSPKGAPITEYAVSEPDGYFGFYALGLLGTGIFL